MHTCKHDNFLLRLFFLRVLEAELSTAHHQDWTYTTQGLLWLHLFHHVILSLGVDVCKFEAGIRHIY